MKHKHYYWQGRDKQGLYRHGELEAKNKQQAKINLYQQGLLNIKIISSPLFQRVNKTINFPVKSLLKLIEKILSLASAGFSLLQIFKLLAEQEQQLKLKLAFMQISKAIASGNNLSSALRQSNIRFKALFLSFIEIAENSGQFVQVLAQLKQQLATQVYLRQQFKKAISYPLFVLFIALTISAWMLFYLIPMFVKIFAQFQAKLPWFTEMLIRLSKLLLQHGFMLAFIMLIIGSMIYLFSAKTLLGRICMDKLILACPIIRTIVIQQEFWQFCYILRLLHQSGRTVYEGLNLCAEVSRSLTFKKFFHVASIQLKQGQALSEVLAKSRWLPNNLLQSIKIAEETGQLEPLLLSAEQELQTNLTNTLLWFTELSEPILMLIIGILMGGMTIAMYLPLFNLGNLV